MSGRAGFSGPPGNLNNCRNPFRAFWKRRALRAQDKWVARIVERYGDGLVADKGGPDEITAAMRHTIELASVARGCAMLILAEAKRSGFIRKIDGTWDLAPGAAELAKFMKLELSALQALGFDRRERKALSIEDITASYTKGEESLPVPVAASRRRTRPPRRTIRATEEAEERGDDDVEG
jgi:hypothetical protein